MRCTKCSKTVKIFFSANAPVLNGIAKCAKISCEKSLENIWWLKIKFLPLHSLSERERLAEAGR